MNVARLERAAGDVGVDTRLIGEITEKAHEVLRALRLDPVDTTGNELYQTLMSLAGGNQLTVALASTPPYIIVNLGDGPISLNRYDIQDNADGQVPYKDRSVAHAQRRLRAEIIRRYAVLERTHNDIVFQLSQDAGLVVDSDMMTEVGYKNINNEKEEHSMKTHILAIGDVFTDAFIQLRENEAKIITEQDGSEWLAMPFGRKPPYEKVDIVKSVGPGPNVAVSAARLGQDASVMAWVGNDETGEEAIAHLRSEGIDTSSMIVEEGKMTSYWYVLRYGADRTMLVKSEKYRYEWRDPEVEPDWIYLTYLGEDSWPLHEALLEYLASRPHIKLAVQPGAFQFRWGAEKMAPIYRRSDMILLNREEAMDVTGLPYDSITNLAKGLHELGPEYVVITDGGKGSYVYHEGKVLTIPNYPDDGPPVDRTGAGDAFSSTFLVAIATGESVETALRWGPINPVGVIQDVGAQRGLMTREKLQEYLDKAPEWYQVSEYND